MIQRTEVGIGRQLTYANTAVLQYTLRSLLLRRTSASNSRVLGMTVRQVHAKREWSDHH
jgi:hypothetical protein